ncbi:MAG: hypothetical protein O3A51_11775, partial [Verrucomicrobia bacterium]|nr:hypothetical protein [Verrucomicrobiota bacterium]
MSASAENFVQVPANQIKPLMSGATFATKSGSGFPMEWTFRPDGRLDGEMEVPSGAIKTDEGKWWTNAATGSLCLRWNNWAKVRQHCPILSVRDNRAQLIRRRDGQIWKTLEIKGNGPRTAQIIAGLSAGGSQQQIARNRPAPSPMAQRNVAAADATPPVIEAPSSLSTDSPTVEIKGRVRDASQIIELSVNGRGVAVSTDGAFSFSRGLPTGTSTLVVVAVDEWGNRGQKEIIVTRKAQIVARSRSVRAVDNKAPTIDLPSSLETRGASVAIKGRVVDASQIIEVTVNGRPIPVQKNGSFRLNRGVPAGTSNIVVAAIDEWGNRAEKLIKVRRVQVQQPAQDTAIAMRRTPEVQKRKDPFAGIHFGSYHALVIGNNRYRHLQSLKSARNDAEAVT